jgi:hypothetical protein
MESPLGCEGRRWSRANPGRTGKADQAAQQAIESATAAGDVAALSVQLEDMKHEFDWRTFLDVDTTIWPAGPLPGPAEV